MSGKAYGRVVTDEEIKQGIAELEALPEIEGSIIYTMEIQTLVNNLRALYLLIDDERTVSGMPFTGGKHKQQRKKHTEQNDHFFMH